MGTLKNKLKNSIKSKWLYFTGLSWLGRQLLLKNGQLILMFHGVSKFKYDNIPNDLQPHIDIKQFENILRWVSKRFRIISPGDYGEPDVSGALLTFDDGFNNNYTNILPLLQKYNIPGLFFITTQHCENPSDWLPFIRDKIEKYQIDDIAVNDEYKSDYFDGISESNLKEMVNNPLVTIGCHSHTHPLLSELSEFEIEKEIKESKDYLERITGKQVDYFAYPSGDYNRLVIEKVKKFGFKMAFGIDKVQKFGYPNYEIPRIGIYDDNKFYLSAKLSGLYQRPYKYLKQLSY